MFAERGFADSRIRDIAETAGAAHGSFYTYFDSKEEIFIALLRELVDLLRQPRSIPPDTVDDPIAQIRHANHTYLAVDREHRHLLMTWEQVATINPLCRAATPAGGTEASSNRSNEPSPNSSGRAESTTTSSRSTPPPSSGMVSNFAYRWCFEDWPFDLETATVQLTLLWCNALGIERPN